MKHLLLRIFISTTLFACKSQKEPQSSETGIGTFTYNSELNYLNKTLKHYSEVSTVGLAYLKLDSILEAKAAILKDMLKKEQKILAQVQRDFLNSFEVSFKGHSEFIDSVNLEMLKSTPIATLSDIDLLVIFIKRSFVSNLLADRPSQFDIVGTTASADRWDIKNGEAFMMQMNITAANSSYPAEWYIIKDDGVGLIKENISDTLYPDETGGVSYKTKKYQLGNNEISFATRFIFNHREVVLYKRVKYSVH